MVYLYNISLVNVISMLYLSIFCPNIHAKATPLYAMERVFCAFNRMLLFIRSSTHFQSLGFSFHGLEYKYILWQLQAYCVSLVRKLNTFCALIIIIIIIMFYVSSTLSANNFYDYNRNVIRTGTWMGGVMFSWQKKNGKSMEIAFNGKLIICSVKLEGVHWDDIRIFAYNLKV